MLCIISLIILLPNIFIFFFFNDTATTEIYTLSLHDALPICVVSARRRHLRMPPTGPTIHPHEDRKSTRLNSSHGYISYAVFCLKKKNKHPSQHTTTHITPAITKQ